MKHLLLWGAALLLGAAPVYGQQIVAAEYFFNTDPGVGNGTAVAVGTPGDSVVVNTAVNASALAVGFHSLSFRFRDANGTWSIAAGRLLYVYGGEPGGGEQPAPQVTAGEYFFDADPGAGNGTAFAVTPGDSTTAAFVVDASALAVGFHTLSMRFKDADGTWSLAVGRLLYVYDTTFSGGGPPAAPIVAAEYFFDADPGAGNGTPLSTGAAADSISIAPVIDLGALPLGDHIIFIRVKDADGVWSIVATRPFRVCETYGPLAEFTPVVSGNTVSFQNASEHATNYAWTFGDGTTSTLQFPVHQYPAGAFTPRLVANNTCGSDTAYHSIEVLGLNTYWPHSGGNTGFVTVALHGYGFDAATVVRLVRPGFPDIGTVDGLIAVAGPSSATVTFDLNGAAVGEWSLQVDFTTTGISATAAQPFTVETGDTEYQLTVALIGSPVIRGSGTYTLRITNNSNIDAGFVPVEVSLSDTLGAISLVRGSILHGLSPEVIDSTLSSFTYSLDGGTTFRRYYYLNALLVPANGSIDVPLTVSMTIGSAGNVDVVLGEPVLFDTLLIQQLIEDLQAVQGMMFDDVHQLIEHIQYMAQSRNTPLPKSYLNFLDNLSTGLSVASLATGLGAALGIVALAPVATVLAAASVTVAAANWYLELEQARRTGDLSSLATPQHVWSTANVIAGALQVVFPVAGGTARLLGRTVPVGTVAKRANQVADASGYAQLISDVGGESPDPDMYSGTQAEFPIQSVGSFDPNEKHGPVGMNGSAYHNGRSVLYTIFYENVDSATAPAQFVTILDSLDATVFDLSSARLMAVGIADSMHAVPSDRVGTYFTDLHYSFFNDLFVRVNFTVDTATGIVACHFLSLDEQTLEPITDPLGGFLPPNVTPPMGEGFIVVSVDLKADVGSGVTVENRAAIIFDDNEPIITNTHVHITDFDRPTSAVNVLPDSLNSNTITVSWSGSDPTSGVAHHNVYYKEVGTSGWWTLAYQHSGTQTSFTGEWGKQYSFFSLATDLAGNKEILDTNAIRTTVLWPDQLMLGFNATPITCTDSANAVLSATGIGGVGPYTYLWSTDDVTESITGLDAGTYTVTVTDALGAQVDSTFVVEQPAPLYVSIAVDDALTCVAGSTAQVTASGTGGAEPYAFHWGGLNFWPTLTNLAAGTYTVRLTDANGCVRRDSVALASPSDLSATAIATPAQNCDGTIEVTPSGGMPPHTIAWADGGLSGFSVSGLCPGTYEAVVEDAAGCSVAVSVVVTFSVGVDGLDADADMEVSPNPHSGSFMLTVNAPHQGNGMLEITDMTGRRVFVQQVQLPAGRNTLHLEPDLAQGMYLLRLTLPDREYGTRVVRQ